MIASVRRRLLTATLTSAALHALVIIIAVFDVLEPPRLIDVPTIELEWAPVTMLDPDQLQGQGTPEPPPPEPPPLPPPPEISKPETSESAPAT